MSHDPILEDFERNLTNYDKVLHGLESASSFCLMHPIDVECEREDAKAFIIAANTANTALREAQPGIPVLRGAIFVQVISRFEAFVRQEVEDLTVRASTNVERFSHLPKEMKENLTIQAATVLANPKRFRMDRFVVTIARTMARNLDDTSDRGEVNQFCMSLTADNMRSSTVDELFKRFGITDVWNRIGTNPAVQIFLQQTNPAQATTTCQKRLNAAVDRRNQIAHGSATITWPSMDEVRSLVNLLRNIGIAMSSLIPVYEIQLRERSVFFR